MARNNNKKAGQWNGFANVKLSKSEAKEAKVFAEDTSTVWALAEEAVQSGYKLTFNYDDQRDAMLCSMSCYDESSPQYRYTMTTHARTMFGSLAVAMYKHNVVCKLDWPVDGQLDVDI